MKSIYVNGLQPSQVVDTVLLVHSKDIRHKRSGEPFLVLRLGDRTGEVDAKMFDNAADAVDQFETDDFVKVKGLVHLYNNRLQLTVHRIRRVEEAGIELEDFFPRSARDLDEMWAELTAVVAGVGNPHLKALLERIFADPDVAARYRRAPAARRIHHAYVGGLIEHVLSLVRLGRAVSAHYPSIDSDLVTAGLLLHDIGKIEELSYERGLGYTTDGQLIGHINIGVRIVGQAARQIPDFPPRLLTLLEHIILSHHGHLEFGSPRLPMFPEALLVHYLDDLDSKIEVMRAAVAQDSYGDPHWTPYVSSLERPVLKKAAFLENRTAPQARRAVAPEDRAPAAPPPEDPVPPAGPAPPPQQRTDTDAAAGGEPAAEAEPTPARSRSAPPRPPSSTAFGDKLAAALSGRPEEKA